jgi:hypothetical protein
MCSYCNYGFVSVKVCCDFGSVQLLLFFDELNLLFVALVEILGL